MENKLIQYQNKQGDIVNAEVFYEVEANEVDGFVESWELIINHIANILVNDEEVEETPELIDEIKDKFEF